MTTGAREALLYVCKKTIKDMTRVGGGGGGGGGGGWGRSDYMHPHEM